MAHAPSDKTIEIRGSSNDLEQFKKQRRHDKEKRKAAEPTQDQKQLKLKRGAVAGSDARPLKLLKPSAPRPGGASTSVIPDEYLPPNKVLFIQNMPDDYDAPALTAVFGQFEGFKEIRLVPGRRGIAFVEYQSEKGAILAKKAIAGTILGDKVIKVTYQRQ
ncbi:hypothetical protein CDD82_2119 [Ophiocordyceps australis]|uniref:RRM domain-containing protein n=1 Tax=Ophiocordyceps australis TaxID=1399860 RepID=A0A2C5XWP7_9HYPO|nr:hypothetical protein CDD82_2119 [Ophiocordyceps australis]